MVFTILPLEGIQWDDQNILLGSTKKDIEAKLGQPDIVRNSYYYFNSELRFDFSENNELEFIEFLSGCNGNIQPIIYGVKAFQVSADHLYNVLESNNSGDLVDCENGYSFAFPNIGIGIYRESTPNDVTDLINEMQETGMDTKENPNVAEEQLKASHWATISVAAADYSW